MLLLFLFFFLNDTATTEIYTLSLHDALPISTASPRRARGGSSPRATAAVEAPGMPRTAAVRRPGCATRRTRCTRTRSEEHTSELQSRQYLVCRLLLEKKKHPSQSLRSSRSRP